ncbi:MAG TPA: ROK family protein [Pseudonocardiaceae bacterium]|nr:ROK family protein [Pseudonocardiaceae bacterium]
MVAVAQDGLSQVVRNLHLLGGSASRAELTELLGCGRSVMGYLLGELTDRGLIAIDRTGGQPATTDGGRPSHRVLVADTAPTVVAAQLSADTVTAARVGLGGHLSGRVERPLAGGNVTDTVDALGELITEVADGVPNLLGVGVAVPSPVRRSDGYAPAALHLGWPGVPLGDLMRERLPEHTVSLGNDANLAALAEYRHGAGRGAAQLVYLTTAHVGLGGAVVSEGRLFLGARGYAIEPGHITVDVAGQRCPCGSTGCLEIEVDHRGLLRAAGRAGVALEAVTSEVADVMAAAADGEPSAMAAVERVGRHLGTGLATLVTITDADRVVLGGTLGGVYRLCPDIVDDQVGTRSFLVGPGEIPIVPGALPDGELLGAAEMALQPLLDNPKRVLSA